MKKTIQNDFIAAVLTESNIPIPTSDCHGYQIADLCGCECPKFNEAYELGIRDDECVIFDEIMEIKKLK